MRRAKYLPFPIAAIALLLCAGFLSGLSGAAINRAQARKVSDAFMAALAADNVDDALNLMEPSYLRTTGRVPAEERMRQWFDYCGRPIDSEFIGDENNTLTYPDGHKSPALEFYYNANTTQYRKPLCTFIVMVVASGNGYRVGNYNSQKVDPGPF